MCEDHPHTRIDLLIYMSAPIPVLEVIPLLAAVLGQVPDTTYMTDT